MEHSVNERSVNTRVASIKKSIVDHQQMFSGSVVRWGTSRVPPSMLDIQKSAFLPKIISIGPIHYASPREDPMYDLKLQHVKHLWGGEIGDGKQSEIGTSQSRNAGDLLSDLVKAMTDLEQRTREFYNETFDSISSDEFVIMMVIDGCFVIELLRLCYKRERRLLQQYSEGDDTVSPNFPQPWLLSWLSCDLMKLENQLPDFVLQELFSLTTSENEPSLPFLCETFFRSTLSRNHSPQFSYSGMVKRDLLGFDHLLGFIRALMIDECGHRNVLPARGNPELIYSAGDLQRSGITFIVKEISSILDISFDYDKGVLWIPPLSGGEDETIALLNIIAFEHRSRPLSPFVTSYFLFLGSLIKTPKDAEILRRRRIIRYPLGTEMEVVDLFNKFGKEMRYSFDSLFQFVEMDLVDRYCRGFYASSWSLWWSTKRERFSVAAIFISILTLLQTIYTMASYHRPN